MSENGEEFKPQIATNISENKSVISRINPINFFRKRGRERAMSNVESFLQRRKLATKAHENQIKAEQAEKLALVDSLTELPNRRALDRDLIREINDYQRSLEKGEKPEELILAILDLDKFKQVNDSLGHDEGDIVLKKMASVGTKHIRNGLIYRLGGDEFAALLKGVEENNVPTIIERIRNTLRSTTSESFLGKNPHEGTQTPDFVGITAGFAIYNGNETKDSLVKRADAAEVAAKAEERGITMYSNSTTGEFVRIDKDSIDINQAA
jgi:diguanylate cyclase